MASITTSGIGSGLNVSDIVAQLVAAERAPTQIRLDTKEAQAQSKLSALGTIRSALASFQSALEPLKTLSAFQGRTTTSANEEVFTAAADADAVPGRYSVEVTSLASAHKIRSAPFASQDTIVGSGTLTISTGSEIFTVAVASPDDTLVEIADAINTATGNSRVLATIVNSVDGAHLVLSSSTTGAASAISVQAAGDPGLDALVYDPVGGTTNMIEVTAAADASLLIDGLSVVSDSNAVSGAIDGVTIDLLGADSGNPHELAIGYDTAGARTRLQAFIDAYNNLLSAVGDQTTFNAETLVAGPLFGESAVRSLVSDIRGTVGGFVTVTSSSFRALAEIGVTTNLDGSLSLDEAALNQAFGSGFDDVGRLFSDEGGFASVLDELVEGFLSPTSALETRSEGLELLIEDITAQREALNRRMLTVEARLTAQFTALDSLIGQLNSTSSFLAQQLASLPGYTTSNE